MSVLADHGRMLRDVDTLGVAGRVSGVRGLTVTAEDLAVPLGATCRIETAGDGSVEARVVGFADSRTILMPLGPLAGICRGDRVERVRSGRVVPVGRAALGRVIDGRGEPIDGGGAIRPEARVALHPEPIPPMSRRRITRPLATGVRALDGLLTVGRGQRIGVFSGPGVGKSVLLGRVARAAEADVTVVALIGERGREVRDFLERDLGREGLARSIVVVATADDPPLLRVQAGAAALCAAEFFRDRGQDVLLLMDSLSRLAAAQRQIGLVAGEPPATRGYPPSVFALLPELLERCGRTDRGSVTGMFTVLVEGDDMAEPVGEAVRAAADGHVYLSRELAHRGHWPAIDVLQSVSRVMIEVADAEHRAAAAEVRRMIALHAEIEDLLRIGAYKRGADPDYDLAVRAMPRIRRFLTQEIGEDSSFDETRAALLELHEFLRGEAQPTQRRGAWSAA